MIIIAYIRTLSISFNRFSWLPKKIELIDTSYTRWTKTLKLEVRHSNSRQRAKFPKFLSQDLLGRKFLHQQCWWPKSSKICGWFCPPLEEVEGSLLKFVDFSHEQYQLSQLSQFEPCFESTESNWSLIPMCWEALHIEIGESIGTLGQKTHGDSIWPGYTPLRLRLPPFAFGVSLRFSHMQTSRQVEALLYVKNKQLATQASVYWNAQ